MLRRARARILTVLSALTLGVRMPALDVSGPFRVLLDTHAAVALLLDAETGAILDANRSAIAFYGYPRERLLSLNISEINCLDAEQIAAERAKAASEERSYFLFPHKGADGRIRNVEVYSSPVPNPDGRPLLLSIVHDISGKHLPKEELSAYTDRLAVLVDERARELVRSRIVLIIAGSVALFLGAGVVSMYLLLLHRRRTMVALREGEERYHGLFLELQHRVKNSMQTIASLISLEQSRNDDQRTREVLEVLRSRVETMATLYTMLHESGDAGLVHMNEYLDSIARSLADSFMAREKGIAIVREFEDLQLDTKKASSVALVLNELLTNAFKYAFDHAKTGTIEVRLQTIAPLHNHRKADGELIVADDGKGLPADFDQSKQEGFGLLVIQGLARQLGGTFHIEGAFPGTICTLRFPL